MAGEEDLNQEVAATNPSKSSIEAYTKVLLAKDDCGGWVIIWADCPSS